MSYANNRPATWQADQIDRDAACQGIIPEGKTWIVDSNPLQVLDMKKTVIKESTGIERPVMKVTGIYQKGGEKNQNGRIYPVGVLKEAVLSIQKPIKERRVLGELDHPADAKIHMDRICHLITKLWMEGDTVYGESEVFNDSRMPCGASLACLIENKVPVGISSRGVGDMDIVNEGGDEAYLVQPGYTIVTFDAVAEPSVATAQLKLMESFNRKRNQVKCESRKHVEAQLLDELLKTLRD